MGMEIDEHTSLSLLLATKKDLLTESKPFYLYRLSDFPLEKDIPSILPSAAQHEVETDSLTQSSAVKTSRSIIRATSLNLLPGLHVSSIYQVLFLGSYCCMQQGELILGSASRLYAFSASPFST